MPFLALLIAAWPMSAGMLQTPDSVRSPRVIVGVVRGDGVLLPLASRQNDTWTVLRSFDSAGRGVFRIASAASLPRDGWRFVRWDAGAPRALALRDMAEIDAHCNRQEGFRTDAPPDPTLDAPHLMSGIATHGETTVVRADDAIRRPDASSQRVSQFVVQLTHALETERAAVARGSARPTIPSTGRERVAVEITTLSRDRVRDADYYYFESRKQYGTVESYASGWVTSSPFAVSVVNTTSGIYSGGETARRRGRVLGVLRIGQSAVWVMEMRGYEGDSYELVEMPPSRQVVSIHGGGC
jgi:hypothetical protein